MTSAAILNGNISDSASTVGAAWSIFGLTQSNGLSAGGKHKEFSFKRWKLVNCCAVEADSLFAAGVFGSILSLNNNGRFAGDKRAGFSRGRDDCFEVDGELYARGFLSFSAGKQCSFVSIAALPDFPRWGFLD